MEQDIKETLLNISRGKQMKKRTTILLAIVIISLLVSQPFYSNVIAEDDKDVHCRITNPEYTRDFYPDSFTLSKDGYFEDDKCPISPTKKFTISLTDTAQVKSTSSTTSSSGSSSTTTKERTLKVDFNSIAFDGVNYTSVDLEGLELESKTKYKPTTSNIVSRNYLKFKSYGAAVYSHDTKFGNKKETKANVNLTLTDVDKKDDGTNIYAGQFIIKFPNTFSIGTSLYDKAFNDDYVLIDRPKWEKTVNKNKQPAGKVTLKCVFRNKEAEVTNDEDKDTIPDQIEDLDSNGDYEDDDTDGDSTPDYKDTDDDGDGTLSIYEDPNDNNDPTDDDTDNDTIPDYLDTDNP